MSKKSTKALKSSFFLVASKWVQRVLGLVSFFFLARILGPDDFGIVAMSFLVLSFFRALTATGAEQYLLSRDQVSESDINTAWTLNLAIKSGVSIVIVLSASLLAELFNEPRLEFVLYCTAAIPIINSLVNPGLITKQRSYEYGAISVCQVLTKLVSFTVTLFIAFKYESYWALVIGDLFRASSFAILSYFILHHKPKFQLKGFDKQWAFSKWMLARSLIGFTRSKADQFIVAKYFTTEAMGAYNVSKELVLLPFYQISEPLRPLFLSLFSDSKNNIEKLRNSYTTKFIIMFAVMLPITCGFYVLRVEIVNLILGVKWSHTDEIIGSLTLLILTYSMTASSSAILVVLDKLKRLFFLEVVTMVVLVIGQFLAKDLPLAQYADVRSLLGAVIFGFYFLSVYVAIKFNLLNLILGIMPSVFASIGMLWVISIIDGYSEGNLYLLYSVLAGATVYIAILWTTMTLAKSRHTGINTIMGLANSIISKIVQKWVLKKPT